MLQIAIAMPTLQFTQAQLMGWYLRYYSWQLILISGHQLYKYWILDFSGTQDLHLVDIRLNLFKEHFLPPV